MKNIKYFLLSFLIIVLAIPNYCTAQNQDKYYLAAGNINNRVYLFDKITLNYNYLSCITKERFRVGPVNAVERLEDISMIPLLNITFSATSLTSLPI